MPFILPLFVARRPLRLVSGVSGRDMRQLLAQMRLESGSGGTDD